VSDASSAKSGEATAADEWTVRKVLEWTTGYLKQHGSESPRLEAEVLLSHCWNCPRIQLYTRYDDPLPTPVWSTMRGLVKRRAAAEPVAYLVGKREFFSLEFEVSPAVLIPRPDTETLLVDALDRLKDIAAPRVLDLCTGSGCVAITLAVNSPHAIVDAVELSPEAAEVARRNTDRRGVGDRVRIIEGDLFAPLNDAEPYDLIVSNPPYISTEEIETLSADVQHEPKLALDGGPDGLDIVRRIIADAPPFLKPGAALLLEISPEQGPAMEAIFAEQGNYENIGTQRDLSKQIRVARGVRR